MERLIWIALRTSAGLFTGACLYIALVEHPARMQAVTPIAALAQFRESIPRAAVMQLTLLIVTLLLCGVAYKLRPHRSLLVGGIAIALIVPITFASLVPINNELASGDILQHVGRAPQLLARWGVLHAARTVLALVGTLALVAK